MDHFHLSDLFPYLTWDCPLNDNSYAATLARIIVNYLGKQEITLTMVSYVSECKDLRMLTGNENVMFRYKSCCISTNGSFYLIEDKFYRSFLPNWYTQGWLSPWSPWTWIKHNKNLKYISRKEINAPAIDYEFEFNADKDKHDLDEKKDADMDVDIKDNTDEKDVETTERVLIQKYLKTMKNRQESEIIEVKEEKAPSHKDALWHTAPKQLEIEKICVVDLDFDEKLNVNGNNYDDGSSSDEKVGFNVDSESCGVNMDGTSDFCWLSPLKQMNNTAMVFVLNDHSMNIFIKDSKGCESKFGFGKHGKILDIWQCNKRIYSIVKFKISSYKSQLQLIKTYFVKKKNNDNYNYNYNKKKMQPRKNKNDKNKEKESVRTVHVAKIGSLKNNGNTNYSSHLLTYLQEKETEKRQKQKQKQNKDKVQKEKNLQLKVQDNEYQVKQKVQLDLIVNNSGNNGVISSISPRRGAYRSQNSGITAKLPNIYKNCNYFDVKSETLFAVENISAKNETENINAIATNMKQKDKSKNKKKNKKGSNKNHYANRHSRSKSQYKNTKINKNKNKNKHGTNNNKKNNSKYKSKNIEIKTNRQGIILRLISKQYEYPQMMSSANNYGHIRSQSMHKSKLKSNNSKSNVNSINPKRKSKTKSKSKSKAKPKPKSKLQIKESKTKHVRSPTVSNPSYIKRSSASSTLNSSLRCINSNYNNGKSNRNRNKNKNDLNCMTVIDEIKPQSVFLNLLFEQSKCHFVFYHKQSDTFILMLKLIEAYENEFKENSIIYNNNTSNGSGNGNGNKKPKLQRSMSDYGDYLTDIDYNSMNGYSQWRQIAVRYFYGRLFVQLKIDFKNKVLISSRIGNIVINENKCRIIAFDETRSMIVYDTLPDVGAQYKPLKHLNWRHQKIAENGWCEYQNLSIYTGKDNGQEARIHNYKMMRINDLVDRWIDINLL